MSVIFLSCIFSQPAVGAAAAARSSRPPVTRCCGRDCVVFAVRSRGIASTTTRLTIGDKTETLTVNYCIRVAANNTIRHAYTVQCCDTFGTVLWSPNWDNLAKKIDADAADRSHSSQLCFQQQRQIWLCYTRYVAKREPGRNCPNLPSCLPNKFIWPFLTSFVTNVPQNVTNGKKILLAPLAALFCTPFSKLWHRPLLRWLVDYTYQ